MRRLAGLIAQVYEEGGDGVGDDRTLSTQHLIAANFHTPHLKYVFELRGVFNVYLQKEDRHVRWDVVVLALLALLGPVFLGIVRGAAAVGDDMDLTLPRRLLGGSAGSIVHLYALLAQLGGALHPRDERDDYDRGDGDQSDRDAGGLLEDVRHGRVGGHDRDHPESERA